MMMSVDEQPSLFVVKLERLKIKLHRLEYEIEEGDFIKDILSKLPGSTENESVLKRGYNHGCWGSVGVFRGALGCLLLRASWSTGSNIRGCFQLVGVG